MNKLTKVKKVIYFILPLLIAIYQVYLVNRIWDFSKKITLMIGILLICALYFVFYLFYKKIDYKGLSKKNIIIITIISIILSGIILSLDFDFFFKDYKDTTVTIYEADQENISEIPISNIFVDNVPQQLDNTQKTSPMKLEFKNIKDLLLVFEKTPEENQQVIIKDGEQEVTVNWENNTYQYSIESNKEISAYSIIRLILSFIMIEILSIIICISTYYLYKKNKSLIIPTLVIVAIIRIIFYQETVAYIMHGDSYSYQLYNFNGLFSGVLQDRVPIYPVIIKIFTIICNDLWQRFLCIAQMILSFISIIYLYKLLRLIIKWENLVALITILYGGCIAVIGWDTSILTESIALSATVLFTYFIISYLKNNKLSHGLIAIILIFFMTFFRPSFIGFVAIVFGFFILKLLLEKENRKKDLICLGTSLITIIMILMYALVFYIQHGIFSITKATVRQDLYICMFQEFYKNSGDEQFINDVEESIKTQDTQWNAMIKILEDYGDKRVQELVKISKKESGKQYNEYLINLINSVSNEYFDAYDEFCVDNTTNAKANFIKGLMFMKFSTVYIVLILEAFVSIYKWIKNRKPDWIYLGLFGFSFTILFTTFVGTNVEFMRTAICVVPFSYIAIGKLASDCIEKYKNE